MAYRQDPDLEFLGQCSSKELDDLVYLLTHDKDGETRWTESLTSNERYKRYYPNHTQYWMEIAEEIQCFGGNTVFNIFRLGKGVLYKEILGDVCDKMKVNYNKSASTEHIEDCLLMKILEQSLEKMSAEEIRELGSSLGVSNVRTLSGPILTAAFLNLFKAGGFASYKASLIIVNAVSKALIGKGLSFAANRGLAKTMSILAGPVGWTITGVWTVLDIASPAYRVTIPAVIQVAYLRKLSQNREEILAHKEDEEIIDITK